MHCWDAATVHRRSMAAPSQVGQSIRVTQLLVDAPPSVVDTATFEAFGTVPKRRVGTLLGTLMYSYAAPTALVMSARHLIHRNRCHVARAVRESIEGVDGVTIKTIHADELREIGCGGLYHVGKAAAEPSRMLILSHGDVSKPSVVLAGAASRKHGRNDFSRHLIAQEWDKQVRAGKGIIYDTGGLSLKPTTGMCGMKTDMAGAAAQFGAFLALAKLGGLADHAPVRAYAHALVCARVCACARAPTRAYLRVCGAVART